MKRYSILIFSILIALFLALPDRSYAQKKKPAPKRSSIAPAPVIDMRPEATKVAEQIKNITRFLYIYGKIANSLEIAEDQVKRGQTSAAIEAKNKQSKDTLVSSISGLRTGLDTVVKSFQANTRLQVQYLKISYAAESMANAEQLAKAGRYDEAGKALTAVVDRLADTMTSMRLQ